MHRKSATRTLGMAAALLVGSTMSAPSASADPNSNATAPAEQAPPPSRIDAIQSKLRAWGLPTSSTSTIDAQTLRAVCSWRELTGKDATRGPLTDSESSEIMATAEATTFRVPPALRRIPLLVNSTCQSAIYQSGGTVVRVIPVSTGKDRGGTRKNGMFRVYRKSHGWESSPQFPDKLGRPNMYQSIYFFGPLAVHGSPDPIMPYPESSGCTRTNPSDQDWLYRRLKVGSRVFSYGNWWSGKVRAFGGHGS